ncbi:MAG: hypothetical protein ABI045_00880 [Flavobacteriales bacterium]
MKMQLRENETNNIDIMLEQNNGGDMSERITALIFYDVTKYIKGIYSRLRT